MKKKTILSFAIALLLLPCLRAFGDIGILDTEKNKLQLYGFFKLDAVYQDGSVNGLTFPRYAVPGDGNLYLSATHTRFGFKYTGTPLNNGMNVAAVLEWDFFDTASPNQMKLRFRQGYFSLQKERHSLLFGQAWDLFSPLGPTTLMTNGYLWQTGNLGFRHAQVRYAYSAPHFDLTLSVSDPATSSGWAARMPVLQGRLGLKLGASNKYQLGISGIYGREKITSTGAPVEPLKKYVNNADIAGVSLDWNLALCKLLTLKGEFADGKNLAYVSSRAATVFYTGDRTLDVEEASSFWTELLFSRNKVSGWLGHGYENVDGKKVNCWLAGTQLAVGGGISFGLEFTHFDSQYIAKTNQVILSAILNL
jgi:hypothetical protein